MWQKFTERARLAILRGRDAAVDLGATSVDPEHLLIALLRNDGSLAVNLLKSLNIDPKALLPAEEPFTNALAGKPDIKLSPESKRMLELAADEARQLNHRHIGTEHLLLAILRHHPPRQRGSWFKRPAPAYPPVIENLVGTGLTLEGTRKAVVEYLEN